MLGFLRKIHPALRTPICLLIAPVLVLAGACGIGLHQFGSVGNSIAFLRGETVHVGNPSQTINVMPHQPFEVSYDVVNLSNYPIKIIGAQSSCTCTSVSELPMTLEPHQSKTFKVNVSASKTDKDQSGSVRLFTTDEHRRSLLLTFTGHPAT